MRTERAEQFHGQQKETALYQCGAEVRAYDPKSEEIQQKEAISNDRRLEKGVTVRQSC